MSRSNRDEALVARVELCIDRVKNSGNAVLQYNRSSDRLLVWRWPFDDDDLVHPRDLQDHRVSHQVLGPCCLCPLAEATQPDFVEAAIYVFKAGQYAGQYVAGCARDRCGYMVRLEQMYNKLGVPAKRYRVREPGEQVPPRVIHISERILGQPRPLKRTYAMLDINAVQIPTISAPTKAAKGPTVSDLLVRLDSRVRPGITDLDFRRLFVKCACGLITTRRAFREHECIIDISSDTD